MAVLSKSTSPTTPQKPQDITILEAHQIASLVQEKALTINEVLDAFDKRIVQYRDELNCILYYQKDELQNQILSVQKALDNGIALPLAGVPIFVKDNICVQGMPMTCGSKVLGDYLSPFDAVAIKKLKEAGAIIMGKTNLDEFAMGSSNETSVFGPVKNPWNKLCVPGGSSGGSAAAVAARFSPVSIGSDTGGSIRQPASFCGIVGHKPAYGRISRFGLVSYASSLDQIGPFAFSVRDAALVSSVMSGDDIGGDNYGEIFDTTADAQNLGFLGLFDQFEYRSHLSGLNGKLRVGFVEEFNGTGISSAVKENLQNVRKLLQDNGVICEDVSIPSLKYAISAYYIIATSEASSNLSRFDGIRYGKREPKNAKTGDESLESVYVKSRSLGFGEEVKQRIMLGAFSLSSGYIDAYYAKANKVRTKIKMEFDAIFKDYDVLISATVPTSAFKIGEKINDPIAMYQSDLCTTSANLAGIAGISVPSGFDTNGLPIGCQLLASPEKEETMLAASCLIEELLNIKGASYASC